MMAGAMVSIAHATGTTVCGPQRVEIAHPENIRLINCQDVASSRKVEFTEYVDDTVTFRIRVGTHPMIDRLILTEIVPPNDSGTGAYITIRDEADQRTLRIGDFLKPSDPESENGVWKLVYIARSGALFLNDGEYAMASIDVP